jgi:hypothetical protein
LKRHDHGWQRWPLLKRAAGVVLVLALLLAVFLAVSPDLHAQIHWLSKAGKGSHSEHQCAATLFAKGVVETGSVAVDLSGEALPAPVYVFSEGICPEPIAYLLLPGRAPPAA